MVIRKSVLETYPSAKSFEELAATCGNFYFDNPNEDGVLICSTEDLGIPGKEIPIKESRYADIVEVIAFIPTVESVVAKTRTRKKKTTGSLTGSVIIPTTSNINNPPTLKGVLEKFVPLFGNIYVHVPHGETQIKPIKTEYGLRINIFCSPSGREKTKTTTLFGLKVGCQDSIIPSSQLGIPILTDNLEEEIVGEIYQNNLYIYNDIVHLCTGNDMKILQKIMEKCHMLMNLSKAQLKEYLSTLLERQYISVINDHLVKQISEKETQISNNERLAKGHLDEYENCINRVRINRDELDYLREKLKSLSPAVMKKEIESIGNLEHVENVTFNADNLVVKTDLLCCTHPETGVVYEIGEFVITIPLKRSITEITWINLTRKVNGITKTQHAPHVFNESGTACLGSAQPIMADLKSKFELKALIAICIQFIESVNITDGAGKYLVKFPIYNPKKEEKKADLVEEF